MHCRWVGTALPVSLLAASCSCRRARSLLLITKSMLANAPHLTKHFGEILQPLYAQAWRGNLRAPLSYERFNGCRVLLGVQPMSPPNGHNGCHYAIPYAS